MLSRVADSIYWMSRYIERADNVARFINVNLHLMLDSDVGQEQQWIPLVKTSGDSDDFEERYSEANKDNVIRFLTFDLSNPNSILSCVRAARENAKTVRENITSSMWQQLNEFYLFLKDSASRPEAIESMNRLFIQIRRGCSTFMGLTDSTMTRGDAWNFSYLGRMLERADKTSRILDVKYFILLKSVHEVGSSIDHIQWGAVLRSASAFEMYRKQRGRISPINIVDFLILDHAFPRAVRFCIDHSLASLKAISGSPSGTVRNQTERILGSLCSDLTYTRVEDVIASGLHEYLDNLQTRLNRVGAGIHDTFFAKKAPAAANVASYRAGANQDQVFVSQPQASAQS